MNINDVEKLWLSRMTQWAAELSQEIHAHQAGFYSSANDDDGESEGEAVSVWLEDFEPPKPPTTVDPDALQRSVAIVDALLADASATKVLDVNHAQLMALASRGAGTVMRLALQALANDADNTPLAALCADLGAAMDQNTWRTATRIGGQKRGAEWHAQVASSVDLILEVDTGAPVFGRLLQSSLRENPWQNYTLLMALQLAAHHKNQKKPVSEPFDWSPQTDADSLEILVRRLETDFNLGATVAEVLWSVNGAAIGIISRNDNLRVDILNLLPDEALVQATQAAANLNSVPGIKERVERALLTATAGGGLAPRPKSAI